MSRDLTPKEAYFMYLASEKARHGSVWDFMENLTLTYDGETLPVHSKEEIALRKQYPMLGHLYDQFPTLYDHLSKKEGGLHLLRQRENELNAYISSKEGDKSSYIIQWYLGELDQGFYYSNLNDQMLLEAFMEEVNFFSKLSLDEKIEDADIRRNTDIQLNDSAQISKDTILKDFSKDL